MGQGDCRHVGTKIVLNGMEWCPDCERQRRRIMTLWHRCISVWEWALALVIPACLVMLVRYVPVEPYKPVALQRREFWFCLAPLVAFVSMWVAALVGHFLLRLIQQALPRSFGLATWFRSCYALRDFCMLAVVFTLTYCALSSLALRSETFYAPASSKVDWVLRRGPLIALAAMASIYVANRGALVTRATFIPNVGAVWPALVVYAGLVLCLYFLVQQGLTYLAMNGIDEQVLRGIVGVTAFCVVMHLVCRLLLIVVARLHQERSTGAVPVTLAIAGPSRVGKTVFMARAYDLLENLSLGGEINLRQTDEAQAVLGPKIDILNGANGRKRDWPPPTTPQEFDHITLFLEHRLREIVQFNWLDLPGGAFTNATSPEYVAARQEFNAHLANCDAAAFMIDASQLAGLPRNQIPNMGVYKEVTRTLYARLQALGSGAWPVPLAIIITKSCMVPRNRHRELRSRVWPLELAWRQNAKELGLREPATRVFLSSAVVLRESLTIDQVPADQPLGHEQCVEAVAWLAAQTLLGRATAIDGMLAYSGRSALHNAVIQLFALAS